MAGTTNWHALIDGKRADRASHIPREWRLPESITSKVSPQSPISAFELLEQTHVLSSRELDLMKKYDVTKLLGMIASKEVASLEVTTAFCKRAAVAQHLVREICTPGHDRRPKLLDSTNSYIEDQLLDENLLRQGYRKSP